MTFRPLEKVKVMQKHSFEDASIGSERSLGMVVVTPSYAPDFALCQDLNMSFLQHASHDVEHHIIVPNRDLNMFASLSNSRTTVQSVEDHLPAHLRKIPGINGWMNMLRPFPPLRGWIIQQLIKLGYAASLDSDLVLLTDSDLVFIDDFDAGTFGKDGEVPLFRLANGVDDTLPRHRLWHEVAHRLLGLDPPQAGALPDYIAWPCAWSPQTVRDMLEHVSRITGKHWVTAIGRELHFSEMILYGVYVENIVARGKAVETTDSMRCLNYSDEHPLSSIALQQFLATACHDDIAVMVSAKSGTPLEIRRQGLATFQSKRGDSSEGN